MTADMLLYLFQLLLVGAALEDIWRLRISNVFPVAILLSYFGWLVVVGFSTDIWQNAALFALVFAAGTVLFAKGWLGGGDVKLLAAASAWFDLAGGAALLAYVAIGGGLVGLGFIMLRRLTPAAIRDGAGWVGLKTRGPIPYGLAIAAGAILCLHLYGANPERVGALHAFLKGASY